jgi:hypothetical protein
MADKRIRDLRRLLEDVAEPFGATVILDWTGKHAHVTFIVGVRQAVFVTSKTPSDWRASRNIETDARRILRQLYGPSLGVLQ